MNQRVLSMMVCLGILAGAAWLADRTGAESKSVTDWVQVLPGVYRSLGQPVGYALVEEGRALLIDAPSAVEDLKRKGVRVIEEVLLTHHHRDTLQAVPGLLADKVRVRAPKASSAWLHPEPVSRYWRDSIPLRNSRTAYLVVPEGLPQVECSLVEDQTIPFGGWTLRVVATPGHSLDHVSFLAWKKKGPKLLFAGDALASAGKLWSPYTTDWDHWTDAGLRPTAESLRKLSRLDADFLLPAHGQVIGGEKQASTVRQALEKTRAAVEEMGFLKSYERYTCERVKTPPRYAFLAKEQAGTNGSKPWSRLAKNLWLTGNTYVLASKDGPCLVVDPWDPHSAKQIPKLQKEETLGKVEVVLCSHAHFDHYDGAYGLLERDRPQVWTLDAVADLIADPFRLRAPFLDARPLTVARRFRDGEVGRWREYTFTFHFLPGQTRFTMGAEVTLEGKKCLFTADNFFHHELYSGTGGWMGLNRSGPALYEQSAQKVLRLAPEWVLAEHGSAMEFSEADFKRRVEWARIAGQAADALCVTGDHRHDWNPHHVRLEPILLQTQAGKTVTADLVVENVLDRKRTLTVTLQGQGKTADQRWTIEVKPKSTVRQPVRLKLNEKVKAGRHALTMLAKEGDQLEPGDAFVLLEVEQR